MGLRGFGVFDASVSVGFKVLYIIDFGLKVKESSIGGFCRALRFPWGL